MTTRATLGDLLALIAHDLKNPLATVQSNLAYTRSFVEELEPEGTEDVREALLDARLASESLQQFVGNLELLAADLVARPPRRRESLPTLDVGSVVDAAVARQHAHAEARRVALVTTHRARGAAALDAEPLLRAVENLLANALQYAPSGGSVDIVVHRVGPELMVDVLDDGPLVAPALREASFTLEGQTELKSGPAARYGRGLGLSAAAIAARLSGGRVELGEQDGRSLLRLRIPCDDGEW